MIAAPESAIDEIAGFALRVANGFAAKGGDPNVLFAAFARFLAHEHMQDISEALLLMESAGQEFLGVGTTQ
jgi:hypothetical protein